MTKEMTKIMIFFSLTFLFLFINLDFTSAQEEDDIVLVKQLTDFDLRRPCFNNGSFCSASATCNLTITRPDGSSLVSAQSMTNKLTYFNRTFSKSQTSVIGTHPSIMSCTDGGVSGADTFNLLITPSGFDDNSIGQAILLLVLGILSLGMMIWGFNLSDGWLVMFGSMLLFVGGLYTLLNGVANYRNDVTLWGSVITLGIASYISVRSGMELMDAK